MIPSVEAADKKSDIDKLALGSCAIKKTTHKHSAFIGELRLPKNPAARARITITADLIAEIGIPENTR